MNNPDRYHYEKPFLRMIETFKNGAMPAMTEEEGGWLLGQCLDLAEQIQSESRSAPSGHERQEGVCPHCELPPVLPAICTPEIHAVIEKNIARDWTLFGDGYDLGKKAQFGHERLRELARFGAMIAHENLFDATVNIDFDESTEGHENNGRTDGDPFGFKTCPHEDCLLVRSGSTDAQEKPE